MTKEKMKTFLTVCLKYFRIYKKIKLYIFYILNIFYKTITKTNHEYMHSITPTFTVKTIAKKAPKK